MRKDRLIPLILVIVAVFLIAGGVYLIYFSPDAVETQEGYKRQDEEQDIADEFIKNLLDAQARAESEALESIQAAHPGEDISDYEIEPVITLEDIYAIVAEDKNYFERDGITYTPDYAKGELAFVLEVPSAGIKRGVYTGTWEEIAYDLDIWMVTLARPDYKLDRTHLAIYGHNHTAQELSFNNLKKVVVGDEFYLYSINGYYRYTVTSVTADWRENVTRNIVDNFSLGADKCYILTCGRDENRYKDVIVEGTLTECLSLSEYAKRLAEEENKN